MWTATLKSVEKDGMIVRYTVVLTDGIQTLTQVYTVSSAQDVKSLVLGTINQLINLYSVADAQVIGNIDLTVISPVVIPLTPADIAQQTFLNDYAQMKQFQTAIQQGLKTITDADIVALKAKLKAEFLPAYLNLL